MHAQKFVLLLGVGIATASCASRPPVGVPVAPGPIQLQAGDAVRLALKDEPELAGEYAIAPDGTVLFPLVGLVEVANRPFDDVTARVREGYRRELKDPVLVLVPLMRVAVAGEARAAGVFMVDPTFSWADVLAQAGGVLPTAQSGRAILIRNGEPHELRFGDDGLAGVQIRSGDRLVVPRRNWMRENMPILIGSATSVLVAAVTTLLVR